LGASDGKVADGAPNCSDVMKSSPQVVTPIVPGPYVESK
jgi:hypothetical protein